MNADSDSGGGIYLYSKKDKEYELTRKTVRHLPVPYYEIENFEKYIIELADKFDATYLLSSHSSIKYAFPIVYSNASYTIYRIN